MRDIFEAMTFAGKLERALKYQNAGLRFLANVGC